MTNSQIAILLSLSVLCGCATAAQRQFQTMRAANEAANAERKVCTTAVYNSPEATPFRAHLPMTTSDLTLQQLSDRALATPDETQAIFTMHSKWHVCRRAFLEAVSKTEPTLVPILITSYNKADDDVATLAQRKISWGEYARRARDRAPETATAIQAEDRRVVGVLKEENAAEIAQRQRATEAFAAWAQTQQIINAANRPVITNCSGFGNTVNCVSR
jgi:hypothetical protein